MSVFIKKVIYMGFLFLLRLVGTTSLNCTSIKNQEVINIDSSNPIFYHFSIKINKCSGNSIILIINMQKFVLLIL